MELENMIKIWQGNIEDAVNILKVNAIVNSANPTLIGSKNHVDGAIHDMVNSKNNKKNFFKKQIRKQFEKSAYNKEECYSMRKRKSSYNARIWNLRLDYSCCRTKK